MGIRQLFALRLMQWLMKNQPEELRAMIRTVSDTNAQSVALQTTMLYLDRLGLLHCAFCPQRFGLRRIEIGDDPGYKKEIYVCVSHYSKAHENALANS